MEQQFALTTGINEVNPMQSHNRYKKDDDAVALENRRGIALEITINLERMNLVEERRPLYCLVALVGK